METKPKRPSRLYSIGGVMMVGLLLMAFLRVVGFDRRAQHSQQESPRAPSHQSPLATPPLKPTKTARATKQAPRSPVMTPTPSASRVISGVLGYSTGGLPIEVYNFGRGPKRAVFIGGIHGGYEWNTISLAYQAIDYFIAHAESIPISITLQIIPSANPDGQQIVTGTAKRFATDAIRDVTIAGRFNKNNVDLNRNWACGWRATGLLGRQPVSGGTAPFSEKETQLLRDFLTKDTPARGVVFWHSSVPGVFAGGCQTIYPAAEKLGAIYGVASGYSYGKPFTYYEVTGDASDWLATQNIPSIEVELHNHDDVDWTQNFQGMLSVLSYLAQ